MHSALEHLFDEHTSPSHASRRAVHDRASPILAIATAVQRQIAMYRELLIAAELSLANDDGKLQGKIEHLHQTLGALERESAAFVESGRRLAGGLTQWDRYMAEAKAALEAVETKPVTGA